MEPRSAVTAMLKDAITWDYQSVEEIFTDLIPKVAPGPAIRKYRQYRDSHENEKAQRREETGVIGPDRPALSQAEQIASGARALLNAALRSLREADYVEMIGLREARQVRRKDRRVQPCPTCSGTKPEPLVALGVLQCNHETEIADLRTIIAGLKEELRIQRDDYEKALKTIHHNSPEGRLIAQEALIKRQYSLISNLTESLRKMVWHESVPKGQWDAEWRKAAMLVKSVDGEKHRARVS